MVPGCIINTEIFETRKGVLSKVKSNWESVSEGYDFEPKLNYECPRSWFPPSLRYSRGAAGYARLSNKHVSSRLIIPDISTQEEDEHGSTGRITQGLYNPWVGIAIATKEYARTPH